MDLSNLLRRDFRPSIESEQTVDLLFRCRSAACSRNRRRTSETQAVREGDSKRLMTIALTALAYARVFYKTSSRAPSSALTAQISGSMLVAARYSFRMNRLKSSTAAGRTTLIVQPPKPPPVIRAPITAS